MKLLVDTHILLWALSDDARLRPGPRKTLESVSEIFVSAATVWEISIKRALGKLTIAEDYLEAVRAVGCVPLSVTWAHSDLAGRLPMHHSDPFDRLLISQAITEAMPILTADRMFRRYEVQLV